MAAGYMEVDFLIVTALPVETDAVKELLEEKQPLAHDTVGKVSREGSATRYDVALNEIGGMGTNAAQAAAREAIGRLNPKRVILIGIAAGFPEAGVSLGDILIPSYIVPYELAKVREGPVGSRKFSLRRLLAFFRFGLEQEIVEYEHRGLPIPVSWPLWHAANTLGRNETATWPDAIKEPRPGGTSKRPVVHSKSTSALGSGEKVVATEFAECRRWLLEKFPDQAIGLEMESFGVLTACRANDIPFLMVKASQDPATRDKDIPTDKDRWRVYAAQAAAAFTIALIRRFDLKGSALVPEHMKEVIRYAQIFERDAPRPAFPYTVSRAVSYALLREGIYNLQSQGPVVLIPNDAAPAIALHGGGGTGKTRIAKSLMGPLIDDGLCPVFVDLRKYPIGGRHGQNGRGPDTLVQEILLGCTIPRRTPDEIDRLAKDARLAVLIDGLNEVSREARMALIDYFLNLHREGTCYLLVTDRFGPVEPLEAFSHATVDRLDSDMVRTVFNSEFGARSFEQLNERLKRIYMRPFFLSLALKYKRKFASQNVWSGIFQEFFLTQLRMSDNQLDRVAEGTLKAFGRDGSFNPAEFRQEVNGEIYQLLLGAEVFAMDESGFEHHLWRDYLVSWYLAQNQNQWKDTVFDAVTTFASSLESLSLTVEQLKDRALKDEFLKAVYDWSYVAAADCIADFREDDPEPRQLSRGIRSAVLAAIAEKRFDAVQRTRQRADNILREHRYEFARPFIGAEKPENLKQHVAMLIEPEDWFKKWKALFTKGCGEGLTAEEIDLIASNDSLIGWTAANLARRRGLDEERQRRIREIYGLAGNADDRKSIRWRVVHVLGAYPNVSNVELLLKAVRHDPYHWVQYGAVRALIEIASRSDERSRKQVIHGLKEFITGYDPSSMWMRHQILKETIEAAFIRNPQPGWKDAMRPVLEFVVERETDPSQREELMSRVSQFQGYDERE